MSRDDVVATIAKDQRRWSLTASSLKLEIGRWRTVALWLAILGAALETLAAQLDGASREVLLLTGAIGAAAIAAIPVIRQWRMGRDRLQAWVVARAASESFKRELYLFRANAGAYAAGNAEAIFYDRRDTILAKASAAAQYEIEPPQVPPMLSTIDESTYLEERLHAQATWYRARSSDYARTHSQFEIAEFTLVIVATILSVGVTAIGDPSLGAWVAVITTIAASIGAHVQSQRFAELTVSYRATADRIEGVEGRWQATAGTLAQLVEATEAVLLQENEGWIAGADEIIRSAPPPPNVAPSGSASVPANVITPKADPKKS